MKSKSRVKPSASSKRAKRAPSEKRKVPLLLVTGYLGAGKTTLINELLSQTQKRVVVLVNEFGEVGVDGVLISQNGKASKVVEFANGCLCCVVSSEFKSTLEAMATQNLSDFDLVLVELSGEADPTSVLKGLWSQPEIMKRFHFSGTVCVVDARNFETMLETDAIARVQVLSADAFIVSKAMLKTQLAELQARLKGLNPSAAFLPRKADEVFSLDVLQKPTAFRFVPANQKAQHGELLSFSSSWKGECEREAIQRFFRELIVHHGPDVIRLKAILHVKHEKKAWVVQGVQGWVEKSGEILVEDGINRLVILSKKITSSEFEKHFKTLRALSSK